LCTLCLGEIALKSTIKDIQRVTGLSLSTISKYLNGGNLLDKNRALIDDAICKLDFKVNQFARSLKTNRSWTIGVLIPELNSTFNTALIANTEDILRQQGYGVIICDSRLDKDDETRALQFLVDKKVDGIITIPFDKSGGHLGLAKKENIPVILIDRLTTDFETDAVIVNNREISKAAICEMINKGHRKIGIISGPDKIYTMKERREGYREALSDNGIPYCKEWDITGDMSITGGYNGFVKMMDNASRPSAVFLVNYEFTLGAVIAMNDKGIRIGNDISVIGFDNMELARVIKPKLTIVVQPMADISKIAAELIIKRLSFKEEIPPEVIMLKGKLEKGYSVQSI